VGWGPYPKNCDFSVYLDRTSDNESEGVKRRISLRGKSAHTFEDFIASGVFTAFKYIPPYLGMEMNN